MGLGLCLDAGPKSNRVGASLRTGPLDAGVSVLSVFVLQATVLTLTIANRVRSAKMEAMTIQCHKAGKFMKFGMRKPSIKKSLRARTTGKWKRQFKRMFIPFYGRKGVGLVKNPT